MTLAFISGIGMPEILIIVLFALVFFGAKRIPEFMKGMGKGIREFKSGMHDLTGDNPVGPEAQKLNSKKEASE